MVDFSHHHRHPQSKRQNQRRQDRELQQTRWAHRLLWRRRVNRHHLRPPPAKLKVTPRSRSPATLPGKPPPAKTKTQPLPWPAAGSNANVWNLVSASKQQTKKITHTPPGQQSTNKKVRIQEDAVMKPSPKIPGTVARTTQGESTVSPAATQYYPPGPSGASPAGTVYFPPSPSSRHGGSQGPTPTASKASTPEGLHQQHHGSASGPLLPTSHDAAQQETTEREEECDDEDWKLWSPEIRDADSDKEMGLRVKQTRRWKRF